MGKCVTAICIHVAYFILLFLLAVAGSGKQAQAASTLASDGSYQLRLVVSLPLEATGRQVYAIFDGRSQYPLTAEGGGLYSLEAEATQSGGEVVIMRGGTQERRDRTTWNAYAGLKLTVEVSYRLNDLDGLELDKVAQSIGRLARVNSTPVAGDNPDPAPVAPPADNPPPAAVKSGATGGNDTEPTWLQSPTTQPSSKVGGTANPAIVTATLTATYLNTGTVIATPASSQPQVATAGVNYFNIYTIIGSLALLLALGVLLLPKLLGKLLPVGDGGEGEVEDSGDLPEENTS